ncbi:TPA: type IV secretion system protein [Kluyvera ascorbata]|nr:type IV secretion system protein [Salmonella enterica]HCR3985063.1 type IV secretion system protein [Kluyvera ascorbata]
MKNFFKTRSQKLNERERAEIYNENIKISEMSPEERKRLDAEKNLHQNAITAFQRDKVADQRRLMWVGFGFGGVGIIAAGAMAVALAALAPLKEVKPYISRVDEVTGQVSIVSAVGDDKIKLSYQNLIDGSNLANFVVERESYDWNSIQNNLDQVKLRSTPSVYEAMRRFIVESPNSPLELLAKDKIMKVGITSRPIVDSNKGVGTVRFYKAVTDGTGKPIDGYPITYWQATITFDYDHKLKSDDDYINNPLGFNVTSYRVDQETLK